MNIVLWIVQVLLGVQFVFHAFLLGVQHEQVRIRPGMSYVGALPGGLRNFIALAELLGGVGVILPAALEPVMHLWS